MKHPPANERRTQALRPPVSGLPALLAVLSRPAD